MHDQAETRGARGATRWTEAEFRRLRAMADPEIDEAVAEYRRAHPELRSPAALLGALFKELHAEPTGFTGALGELATGDALPSWGGDGARIERGQRVFNDHGLYQSVALFFACLPLAYAAPAGAKVLVCSSDLANGNVSRRIAQTGQMLINVMGMRGPAEGELPSLAHGGRGYGNAIGLRLLHSCIRALVLDLDGPRAWDSAAYGPPVNQELLLATLLDFSLVTWKVMERMGITLSEDDRAANLYTWSVFGHLMGVEACREGPLALDELKTIRARLDGLFEPTREGRQLMAALLEEMEEFMVLGWRKLPRSLIHWLFKGTGEGVDVVPALLGVPRPAWWSAPLFATAAAAQRFSWLPDPLRPVARRLIRRLGRAVVITYADRFAGDPVPFEIPAELARRWRLRQRPVARHVREKRRQVRGKVRTALRHSGGQAATAAADPYEPPDQRPGERLTGREEEERRHGSPRTRNADHRHPSVH
ncbi:oxygenase MpaB family protein [Spirillospora sp. NPDC048911]|uniref:oxygenase MpaB family protein n=1 Tax=Spirillospora sp. NPDC048911 TaxID=3364527 RepID=UPI00371CC1C7